MTVIYNAGSQFFTMKNDADTHRKALGLKPRELYTLRIDGRDDLVTLLNGLCQGQFVPVAPTVKEYPQAVADNVDVEDGRVPDYVPTFLLNKEQREQRS